MRRIAVYQEPALRNATPCPRRVEADATDSSDVQEGLVVAGSDAAAGMSEITLPIPGHMADTAESTRVTPIGDIAMHIRPCLRHPGRWCRHSGSQTVGGDEAFYALDDREALVLNDGR